MGDQTDGAAPLFVQPRNTHQTLTTRMYHHHGYH